MDLPERWVFFSPRGHTDVDKVHKGLTLSWLPDSQRHISFPHCSLIPRRILMFTYAGLLCLTFLLPVVLFSSQTHTQEHATPAWPIPSSFFLAFCSVDFLQDILQSGIKKNKKTQQTVFPSHFFSLCWTAVKLHIQEANMYMYRK